MTTSISVNPPSTGDRSAEGRRPASARWRCRIASWSSLVRSGKVQLAEVDLNRQIRDRRAALGELVDDVALDNRRDKNRGCADGRAPACGGRGIATVVIGPRVSEELMVRVTAPESDRSSP